MTRDLPNGFSPYEHVVPRDVYEIARALHEARVACRPDPHGYDECRPAWHHDHARVVVEALRDRGQEIVSP